MRTLITIFSLLLTTSVFAQTNWDNISPILADKMEAEPEATMSFYVLLKEQVDVLAMHRDFNAKKVTQQERISALIPALQAVAKATQQPIIDALANSEFVEEGSITPLWISNMVYAKGTAQIIEELSRRDDIEIIDENRKVYLHDFETVECSVGASPNGSEPGHRAIKADKLWAMGYTGYGHRAMIIDTGTDERHPSLEGNYVGLYFGHEQGYTGTGTVSIDCELMESHGTHVAGTTVGLDRATNDTIGVAFNALWIGAPAIECGASNGLSTNQSFQWALDPDGNMATTEDMPAVINNSWGIPTHIINDNGQTVPNPGANYCGTGDKNALDALEAAGIAVVFSAGNNGGSGTSTVSNPADLTTSLVNTFTVASVNGANPNFPLSGFSSRGPSTCSPIPGSLEIKPEVAAPGSNVRSAFQSGGYNVISGTSMAAPHVSGAVLLLKEAFPTLTGETIKLALYNTCIDLGAPGEDNNYGMGIIDVLAAFNYLVDQGNTPVDPNVQNDALLTSFEMDELFCGDNFTASISFENGGTNALTSLTISYEILDGGTVVLNGTFPWTGNLATGQRTTYDFPEMNGLDGTFDFIVTLQDPNGNTDTRPLNNKLVRTFITSSENPLNVQIAGQPQASPCGNSNALLFLDLEEYASIQWFVQQSGGAMVGEGQYFLTPALPNNFTFYADVTLRSHAGIIDKDDTPNEVASETGEGLIFDALADIHLKSVTVFAESPGFNLVSVQNSAGGTLKTKLVNITTAGKVVVDLDVDVPTGQGYKVLLNTGGNLYRSTGATFPYKVNSVIRITESTDFSAPLDVYNYFYDFVVDHKFVCGRAPVTVEFNASANTPTAAFDASTTVVNMSTPNPVNFTNNSTNGASYLWNFGDGTTSTDFSPSHIFNEVGIFIVSLTTINAEGCSDSEIIEINVEEVVTAITEVEAQNQIKVFPNPTRDRVNVNFDFSQSQNVAVYVVDLLGRRLSNISPTNYQNDQLQIDLAAYANGIYYLVFNIEGTKVVKKIVKMQN